MKSAVALIAFGLASMPAFAAETDGIDPKAVPVMVFERMCLAGMGDTGLVTRNLRTMKAEHPKLLTELSEGDRKKLFGDAAEIGWVFAPSEAGKPFMLDANAKGCNVNLYGSTAELKTSFESTLQRYALAHDGKFYLSGDASFLNDKSKTGFAYTVEMPQRTAYVMIVESNEIVGDTGHPIELMSMFQNN